MTEATYQLEYAIKMLCDAVDFAEIEGDFAPVRKWANEVEKSAIAESELGSRVIVSGGEILELSQISQEMIF